MITKTSRARAALLAALCLALLLPACGGAKAAKKTWPPAANPGMDGLYPYRFAERGLEGLKKLRHQILLGKLDKKNEDLYLFAYGRGLIDATIYALLAGGEEQAKILGGLGDLLEIGTVAGPGDVEKNAAFFVEPLLLLAKRCPSSPFAASVIEARRVLAILTSALPSLDTMVPLSADPKTKAKLSLAPQFQAAYAFRAMRVLESAREMDEGSQASAVIRGILPYVSPKSDMEKLAAVKDLGAYVRILLADGPAGGTGEADPVTLGLQLSLSWGAAMIDEAAGGDDLLTPEIKTILVERRRNLEGAVFSASVALDFPLPAVSGGGGTPEAGPDGAPPLHPFFFVTLSKEGEVRVAAEPLLKLAPAGAAAKGAVVVNRKSPTVWPGKVAVPSIANVSAEDRARLLAALAEADSWTAASLPAARYAARKKGRAVAVAVDGAATLAQAAPLVELLRGAFDTLLLVARDGDRLAALPVQARPNCPGEGTRLTLVFRKEGIAVQDTTEGEAVEKLVARSLLSSPLEQDVIGGFIEAGWDLSTGPTYIETARESGTWSWEDLVRTHAGVAAAVAPLPSARDTYVYILPGITMTAMRGMEEEAEAGEEIAFAAEPGAESLESFVVKGLFRADDEEYLDASLGAYLAPMGAPEAAAVVLNVARCWGGSFRERAEEALAQGDAEVLGLVADYLADETLSGVAGGALAKAGKTAVPSLVRKLAAPDEKSWTVAWTVLAGMGWSDTGEELTRLLESPDPEIRTRALKLVGELGPPGGVAEILPLIDDEDETVRRWAIAAAGMLGMKQAVGKLAAVAGNGAESPAVVSDAIFALGLLEAGEQKDLILSHKAHGDPAVRAAVALSLGNLGMTDGAIFDALLALLGDESPDVRRNALASLALSKDPSAIPAVEALLDDPSEEVREAARLALKKLAKKPVPAGAGKGAGGEADACLSLAPGDIAALAKEPGEEAFACLAKLTKSKDPLVRKAACEALGERGDKKAAWLLEKRTRDKSMDVRKAAKDALKKLEK